MSSRGNRDDQEESNGETEDEDYTPDDEESEEEYVESEYAAADSPEIEVFVVPEDLGHESEDRDEETVVLVEEERGIISPERECEENRSAIGEQSQSGSDSSCLPCCPICLAPWTSDGIHRVCCIPCGHVYGRSCLEKWIRKCKKNAVKCPQCCARFKQREMINLYAPLIAVTNIDLEKELLLLREKNESLALERDRLLEEIKKSKKMACFEVRPIGSLQSKSSHADEGLISVIEPVLENRLLSQNNLNMNGSTHHRCVLQNEIPVEGARVLGIDASSQILVVSGKKPEHYGEHILNKISLLGRYDIDRIQLPPMTGAVRDLCILPGSLALIASLGKKLLLLSMISKNLVLKYDLPAPAWSCSGDVNEPYQIYTGLQNGMLLMFDIRQTAHCLESIEGLSRFPIHSICSLKQNHCSRKVLTASSIGLCLWHVSGCGERPFMVPELESQGICVSLASDSSSSDIVASFRPKMDLSSVPMSSQTAPSPSQPFCSATKLGSHVHLSRVNDTYFQKGHVVSCHVSELRMSKSAIICCEGKSSLFACGDESTRGVNLWNLPSFQVHSRHQPHQSPILDMKYSNIERLGLLGCISENKLQIFSCF